MTSRRLEDARAQATDLLYGLGWRLVCRLPEPVAYGLFRRLADLIWRRHGPTVQRYEANLRPLLDPDLPAAALRTLTRAGLRSYLRYWCEAFRLPTLDPATVRDRVVVTDEHLLRDAVAEGRGVIAALPHMANWDHAGAWLASGGEPFTTVAERLKPASLFDRFVAYRESLGMEVLAAADPDVFATLAERLRSGRVVCLVADRDLSARGVAVRMGRGRTRFPVGPAALALRTRAPLLPVVLWYDGPRLRIRFYPRVERPEGMTGSAAARAMTQQVADVFAAGIAAHPEDWHMLQRFWLDEPGAADVGEPLSTDVPGGAPCA